MYFKSSKLFCCLCLVVAISSLWVECKSISRLGQKQIVNSQRDLLALPNVEYRQMVTYETGPRYAIQDEPNEEMYQATPSQAMDAMDNEYVSDSNQDDGETQAQTESSQTGGSQEPTEVLYTDNSGNLYKQVGDHYEPADETSSVTSTHEQPEEQPTQPAKNSEYSESSGMSEMSATILTEIPVKDVSEQVLEQLRKEYGAKVIATREYPGADLVINCGSRSNQEISICSKHRKTASTNYLSYPLLSSTLDDQNERSNSAKEAEQDGPTPHDEDRRGENAETYTQEPPTETYETTEKLEPENGEGYGYRGSATTTSVESSEISATSSEVPSSKEEEPTEDSSKKAD